MRATAPAMRSAYVSLLLLTLAACSASHQDQDDTQSNTADITNAVATTKYPAVAQLVMNSNEWCTTTLIAPQILLTAAHCVFYNNADIEVRYGSTWYIADKWTWNSKYNSDPNNSAIGLQNNDDIALVHLPTPVLGVTPMPLMKTGALKSGAAFTIVGFGEAYSGQGNYRTKREAPAIVGAIHTDWFYGTGDSSPCHADSGGPAIDADGIVIGVFDRMKNDCSGGVNGFAYMSTLAMSDWIETESANFN